MSEKIKQAKPSLIIVCGLQGTGKSTIAKYLAEHHALRLLRSDEVRKALYAKPVYTEAESNKVYAEVFRRATEALDKGCSIILDATFAKEKHRHEARVIAECKNASFVMILANCDDERVVKKRLSTRTGDASDADWDVYQQAKARFEPLLSPHSVIYNCGTKEELYEKLLKRDWSELSVQKS